MWFPNERNNNQWNPPGGATGGEENSGDVKTQPAKKVARQSTQHSATADLDVALSLVRGGDDVVSYQSSLLRLQHLRERAHQATNSSLHGSGLPSFQPTDMSRDASVRTMRSILLGQTTSPTQELPRGTSLLRTTSTCCTDGGRGGSLEATAAPNHHDLGLLLSQLQRQRTLANLIATTSATAIPSQLSLLAMASILSQPGSQPPPQVSSPFLGDPATMSPMVTQYLILNALQRAQEHFGSVQQQHLPVACAVPTPSGRATSAHPSTNGRLSSELRPPSLSGQKRSLDSLVAAANYSRKKAPVTPLAGTIPESLPVLLGHGTDRNCLSAIQAVLREQIEVFEAGDEDVSTYIRGRNKLVKLGQLGIRCRHCAHKPVMRREKGSTYYPTSVWGIYQASQNMWKMHLEPGLCVDIPRTVQDEITQLEQSKQQASFGGTMPSGAGRAYWAETAQNLGLVDTVDGMYFIRNLPPDAQLPQLDNSSPGVYRKTQPSSSKHSKRE